MDGQRIIFVAGRFLASLSPEDGQTAFIAIQESAKAIVGLQISPNKRFLAAVELIDAEQHDGGGTATKPHAHAPSMHAQAQTQQQQQQQQQQVSIYSIASQNHVRTLPWDRTYTMANSIVATAFRYAAPSTSCDCLCVIQSYMAVHINALMSLNP
jgi:hypothetical protein